MTPPRTGIDRHRNERAAPALAGMHAPKGRALRKLAWIFACTGLTSALVLLVLSSVTHAACGHDGAGFDAWLAQFRQRAALQGISPTTISSALAGITYDPTVVRLDRSQKSFKLSFEQFYARRVGPGLMRRGQSLMRQHQVTLDRIEQHFGVPGPILIAIWGLETNYGADSSGKYSIIRSVATLAYDCRRSEFFTEHLLDALRILDRGDLTLAQLRGGWAGEIGHTQFLPKNILAYGTGDLNVAANALNSTANFLRAHGWRAGAGYQPGEPNFAAIEAWNAAQVYQKAIAIMGRQIDGQ